MESLLPGIPTPNEWVERRLRELNISNAALARIIGQDRSRVQRWINNREQIPKHQLAEIAVQIGTPDDLAYAIKLKECEDFADGLRRKLREFAKAGRFDPSLIELATFKLLASKTEEEHIATSEGYLATLLYNMTHASFIFRLLCDAAASKDFDKLLTPENIKLHVRYPANHFLGLALNIKASSGLLPEYQEQCLEGLRKLAVERTDGNSELSFRDHAIHMLGRFGSAEDQAIVADIVEASVISSEPFSVRLGYAGLMLQKGNEHLPEKYAWLLRHDEQLAFADLAFDAMHYGDVPLMSTQGVPRDVRNVDKSLSNLLRRLHQPDQYAAIRTLDTYRLCVLLDRVNPHTLPDSLKAKLAVTLERTLAEERNEYSGEAEARIMRLLH